MEFKAFVDALHAPVLADFVSRNLYRYMTKAEFLASDLPADTDPEELWDTLCGLRHLQSHRIATPTSDADINAWLVITPAMSAELTRLTDVTSPVSAIGRALKESSGRLALSRPFIYELQACLKGDGQKVGSQALQTLISGARPPQSAADRAVLKVLQLMEAAEDYTSADFSPRFMEGLASAIDATNGLAQQCGVGGPDMPYYRQSVLPRQALESIATEVTAFAEDGLHPVLITLSVADILRQYKPFERWNCLLSLVVRAVSYAQHGYPALAWAPFGHYDLLWENGELPPKLAAYQINETGFESSFGIDLTCWYDQKVKLLVRAVDELAEALEDAQSTADRLSRAIKQDCRLNYRQIEILEQALADPLAAFDLPTHQQRYNVAPMTARTDLQKLVELDYLYRSHAGKRTCYKLCPDIEFKLARFLED